MNKHVVIISTDTIIIKILKLQFCLQIICWKIFIIVLPVCQVNISAFATVTTNMTATVFGLCFYYLARMILLMESFAVEILLRQIIQSLHILSEFTGKYLMNIFLVEISY